ncbi:MAG: N-6 DNA methylase [Bacteroidota bacterium]
MENIEALEKRLWGAADQLRANSGLGSNEYFMPVMGLIFLRHAFNRFLKVKAEIEPTLAKRQGVSRPLMKEDFAQKAAIYLRDEARFDYLVALPEDQDPGSALNKAMEDIEADYTILTGNLPKEYTKFEPSVLRGILRIFNDSALNATNGDVFGRIYEYFLMKFAAEKAHDGGEFYTPVSIVQTIVNVIEPDHGKVFDPACGSGGMLVQTSHFLEQVGKPAYNAVTFYGQEKNATTIKFTLMNLTVHGLEGKIAEGNTFYEDQHEMLKKADFVMANPPFNVDGVDAEKIKTDPRLPFGLPGVNNKKAVSNGNYLWISYFYSYLNAKGRAGFVMSSQASGAGHGEKDVRRKIVETGHVDVMISIRSNFFYTRSVPCELWFFDKGKPKDMIDKVLMIDARNIHRKVTRKIYDFSPEQLKNITAIVWLYRSKTDRYLALIKEYLKSIVEECIPISEKLKTFETSLDALKTNIDAFASTIVKGNGQDKEKRKLFIDTITELTEAETLYKKDKKSMLQNIDDFQKKYENSIPGMNAAQIKAQETFSPIAEKIKGLIKQIDLLCKIAVKSADIIEKDLHGKQDDQWNSREVSKQKKEFDILRKDVIEQLKLPAYFHKQAHWLQTRFPDAKFADVEGLVKLVDRNEITKSDWSLTPGRYVGVSPVEEDEDFDFEEVLHDIYIELFDLNKECEQLARTIQQNFEELGI